MPDERASDEARERQIRRMVKQFELKLRKELKPGPKTLDEMEDEAVRIGDEVKQVIVDEMQQDCGTGYAGSHLACSCGGRARYKGLQERMVVTCAGVHRFRRAYYYCPSCGRGWCPLDALLLLPETGECSKRVRSLAARFCCYLPYRIAADELDVICGVRLAPSTISRIAQCVGGRISQSWRERERLLWEERLPLSEQRPKQLHASMDGVFIFVDGDWHEAKLGCAYQTSGRKSSGGQVTRATYCASMAKSSRFGRLMRTLVMSEGGDRCSRVAFVADGGPWIWQEAGKYFACKTQILDFFHATEHLWEAARAMFGDGSDAAKNWMTQQEQHLHEGQADEVLSHVSQWRPGKDCDRQTKRKLIAYLKTHRSRMQYNLFKQEGWHIGSGVIEAGCKCVVKARMGGAGMRWSGPGAEAMLNLCATWRSTDRVDFMKYAA